MIRRFAICCLLLLPALPSSSTASDAFTVGDGDGLRAGKLRVRLWGVDAPELDQRCWKDGRGYDCGLVARDALRLFIGSHPVECREVERDRYGRSVARCTVAGADLGMLMVLAGWAVDYEDYSGGFYAVEQEEAKEAGRGLWSGRFDTPAEWRKKKWKPRRGG